MASPGPWVGILCSSGGKWSLSGHWLVILSSKGGHSVAIDGSFGAEHVVSGQSVVINDWHQHNFQN